MIAWFFLHAQSTQISKERINGMLALRRASSKTIPSDLVAMTAAFHQGRKAKVGQVVKMSDKYGDFDGMLRGQYCEVMEVVNDSDSASDVYRVHAIDIVLPGRPNIIIESRDIVAILPNIYIHWIDYGQLQWHIQQNLAQYLWKILNNDPEKDVIADFRLPLIAGDRWESRRANKMKHRRCWSHLQQFRRCTTQSPSMRIYWIKGLFIECCPKIMNDAFSQLQEQGMYISDLRGMYDFVFGEYLSKHPSLKYQDADTLTEMTAEELIGFDIMMDQSVKDYLHRITDLYGKLNIVVSHLKKEVDNYFEPDNPGSWTEHLSSWNEIVEHYMKVNSLYTKKNLHWVARGCRRQLMSEDLKTGLMREMGVSKDVANVLVKSFNANGADQIAEKIKQYYVQ